MPICASTRSSLSNLGMIVTFVACGMWHGEAVHFLIWGAYHGLGISVLTIYQRQKRKVRERSPPTLFPVQRQRRRRILLTSISSRSGWPFLFWI